MSDEHKDWLEELCAEQQRRRDQLPALKTALIAALERREIVSVSIEYDGAGDSGQIGDITARNQAGLLVELRGSVRLPLHATPPLLIDAIHEFTWEVLGVHHRGFEINEGGFGTFTIDVAKGTVTLHHNDRIIELSNTVTEV